MPAFCSSTNCPEFSSRSLQALRQPMEMGRIVITPGRWQRCASRAIFSCRGGESLALAGITATLKKAMHLPTMENRAVSGQHRRSAARSHRHTRRCVALRSWRIAVADGRRSTPSACWRAFWLLVRFRSWRRAALGDGDAVDVGALLARCRLAQRTRGLLETVSRTQLLSGRGITRALMVARYDCRHRRIEVGGRRAPHGSSEFQASKGGIAAMEERFSYRWSAIRNRTWHEDYQMSSRLCLSRPNGSM